VLDDKGDGMPGATIVLKGTSLGTTTDENGKFSLRIPDGTATPTLVISSIGYVKQEIPVGSRITFEVKLNTNAQDLNEVVVVGYGAQKRSDITGSVVSVPQDRLEDSSVEHSAGAGRRGGGREHHGYLERAGQPAQHPDTGRALDYS
jgi:hypothetical protein